MRIIAVGMICARFAAVVAAVKVVGLIVGVGAPDKLLFCEHRWWSAVASHKTVC